MVQRGNLNLQTSRIVGERISYGLEFGGGVWSHVFFSVLFVGLCFTFFFDVFSSFLFFSCFFWRNLTILNGFLDFSFVFLNFP